MRKQIVERLKKLENENMELKERIWNLENPMGKFEVVSGIFSHYSKCLYQRSQNSKIIEIPIIGMLYARVEEYEVVKVKDDKVYIKINLQDGWRYYVVDTKNEVSYQTDKNWVYEDRKEF